MNVARLQEFTDSLRTEVAQLRHRGLNADVLAVLLSDPMRVENLPPEQLPELLGQVARLEAVLRLRLNHQPLANGSEVPPAKTGPDRLLTPQDVSKILQRSVRYVYDHADEWPFTRRLGTRTIRFDSEGFDRWLERQR